MADTEKSNQTNRGWYPITADGSIVNSSSIDLIPTSIKPALVDLAREINALSEGQNSVYLRGSAARGTYIKGMSDIDLTVICADELSVTALRQFNNKIKTIIQANEFGSELDLVTVTENSLRKDDKHNKLCFLLEIQGLCLSGPKVPGLCSNINLSNCHFEITSLTNFFTKFEKLMATSDQATVLKLCHKIMKILIRAGFELVMEKEHKYTRELTDCVAGFSNHFPKRAADMEEALGLAVKPVLYNHHLQFLTRSLNTFILVESARLKQ